MRSKLINPITKSKAPAHLIASVFRWLILIVLSAPLGYALYKQWIEVKTALNTIDWGYVAVGTLVQLAALPLMGLISWIVLLYLNSRQTMMKTSGIYFISQIAKYLPGGIWAFPGRAVAYQAIGVDKVASILSVMREVIVLFLGAAVMGLLGLLQGLPMSEWINLTTLLGLLICIVLVVLTQIPAFWKLIQRIKFFQRINLTVVPNEQSNLDLRWLGYSLFVSLTYWLVTGIGFYYIVTAVTPSANSLTWLQASSIFSLAWCVGFVVVIAPAGIGVRESALALLLSPILPVSEALSVAIIARLWWTVSEAVYILIALLWLSGKANRFLIDRLRLVQQSPAVNDPDTSA